MKTTIRNVMLLAGLVLLFSCDSKKTRQDDFDSKAITMIQEFYNKFVFDDDNFSSQQEYTKKQILNNYCTKKLIDGYLIEDGMDDGPFYYLGEFVNGSQDYGIESRLTDVEALGDGKYKVHFIVYGKGFLVIKVVMDDGVLKLDEITDGGWEDKNNL